MFLIENRVKFQSVLILGSVPWIKHWIIGNAGLQLPVHDFSGLWYIQMVLKYINRERVLLKISKYPSQEKVKTYTTWDIIIPSLTLLFIQASIPLQPPLSFPLRFVCCPNINFQIKVLSSNIRAWLFKKSQEKLLKVYLFHKK